MTRRQTSIIIGIFVLAFLWGAFYNLPITQLLHFIKLPPQVAMQGVQGSITRGKVDIVEIQGYRISELEYHWTPGCLIKLTVCYQLYSYEDGILLNLERSLLSQNTLISDSYIELSSNILAGIPNLLVKPSGDFRVEIGLGKFDDSQRLTELKGRVLWNNAGVVGEKQVFGNYTADLVRAGEGIEVSLSSSQDSLLGLKGDIELNWNGRFDSDIMLENKAGLNPSLVSVLDISAKKTGLNQYHLQRKGVLPANIIKQMRAISPKNTE
jgi:hypothetical protein